MLRNLDRLAKRKHALPECFTVVRLVVVYVGEECHKSVPANVGSFPLEIRDWQKSPIPAVRATVPTDCSGSAFCRWRCDSSALKEGNRVRLGPAEAAADSNSDGRGSGMRFGLPESLAWHDGG